MYQPTTDGKTTSNVFDEHEFRVRITFGSSAVASYKAKDVTVARANTGRYTITLPKNYRAITAFYGSFTDASGAILFPILRTSAVDTTGILTVETVTETGTATDPTSGDVLYLTVAVSDNILNDSFGG